MVEFGLIAILFTLLMFALVDFGLLLNTWLSASAATRQLARAASVEANFSDLSTLAISLSMPSVSTTSDYPQKCCAAGNAITVRVQYFTPSSCLPPTCDPILDGLVDSRYGGTCASCGYTPHPGDNVRVTMTVNAAQVITPLVRPFFNCNNGSRPCYVKIDNSLTMRVEGLGT